MRIFLCERFHPQHGIQHQRQPSVSPSHPSSRGLSASGTLRRALRGKWPLWDACFRGWEICSSCGTKTTEWRGGNGFFVNSIAKVGCRRKSQYSSSRIPSSFQIIVIIHHCLSFVVSFPGIVRLRKPNLWRLPL